MTAVAPGLAIARGVESKCARRLAYIQRIVELVGRCTPGVEAARAVVVATNVDREGTITVRTHDVRGFTGISTTDTEHELRSALAGRGFGADLGNLGHGLRVCFSEDACLVGRTAVETARDFTDRKLADRSLFQPGGATPVDTRAFVDMAGVEPSIRILDLIYGADGVLLETGLAGVDVVGVDAQVKMIGGARENLHHYVGSDDVVHGDATALPPRDDSMDDAMFNVPYGRRSKIARHSLTDLVGDTLAEVRRVVPECVMVANRS